MPRGPRGAPTPAVRAAQRAGVRVELHEYAHDPGAASYGIEAAEALGVDPARVLKTLVAAVDGALWVAVVPVEAQLDLKRLAAAAGGKRAAMAPVVDAERATGYAAGGISPLGQRRSLPTVVEASALAHATVFVSGGRRGLEIELAPAELVRLTDARTAPVARL
jgi:Cys-tRNA(Pro)/Cys-tRNA(Cys) deacylase